MKQETPDKHAENIQHSLEKIIGSNTILKRRKKSEEDNKIEQFEKIIITLEEALVRDVILKDIKIDISGYTESLFTVIDNLISMLYGKEAVELIFFYVYDRINDDGSINPLSDENGNILILKTPTDLWNLIQHITKNKIKK